MGEELMNPNAAPTAALIPVRDGLLQDDAVCSSSLQVGEECPEKDNPPSTWSTNILSRKSTQRKSGAPSKAALKSPKKTTAPHTATFWVDM